MFYDQRYVNAAHAPAHTSQHTVHGAAPTRAARARDALLGGPRRSPRTPPRRGGRPPGCGLEGTRGAGGFPACPPHASLSSHRSLLRLSGQRSLFCLVLSLSLSLSLSLLSFLFLMPCFLRRTPAARQPGMLSGGEIQGVSESHYVTLVKC